MVSFDGAPRAPWRRSVLVMALLGAISGCASEPEIVGGTPTGITIKYEGEDLQAATVKAADYCRRSGRTASLVSVTPKGDDRTAIFNCV